MDEITNEKPNFSEKEIEDLKKAFSKYDKKLGTIKPDEVADCFRMAGQNPTLEESSKMIEEAEESYTGMITFADFITIIEKYWKSFDTFERELKEACSAFDKNQTGVIDYQELKQMLLSYGEKIEEDDIGIFEKAVGVKDGKIAVEDFVRVLSNVSDKKDKKDKGNKKDGKETSNKDKRTSAGPNKEGTITE